MTTNQHNTKSIFHINNIGLLRNIVKNNTFLLCYRKL